MPSTTINSIFRINTRTLVWDMTDLDNPVHVFSHDHGLPSIDHNLYIKEGFVYESNYRAGLRILDLSCLADGNLVEVAYFDTYPGSDAVSYSGNWSNYPFYRSGVVVVSGIEQGLFILQPNRP